MRLRVLLCAFVLAVIGTAGVVQSAPPTAAEEVIAMTRAQWAAEMKKDIAGTLKIMSDDYTEFNQDFPVRLEGKSLHTRLAEAQAGAPGGLVAADMVNEKVQVYGDVAILSYNFVGLGKDKDGKVEPSRAKSTRVYVKKGGQWWLVHANFAPGN